MHLKSTESLHTKTGAESGFSGETTRAQLEADRIRLIFYAEINDQAAYTERVFLDLLQLSAAVLDQLKLYYVPQYIGYIKSQHPVVARQSNSEEDDITVC